MLVLSRKKNEKIMIADNIEVVVLEIRGDRVRLGIVAPADIKVHREEITRREQDAGKVQNMLPSS
jgi:carbon storage regulator